MASQSMIWGIKLTISFPILGLFLISRWYPIQCRGEEEWLDIISVPMCVRIVRPCRRLAGHTLYPAFVGQVQAWSRRIDTEGGLPPRAVIVQKLAVKTMPL